jgi:DNA-binding response OmpR family regulator
MAAKTILCIEDDRFIGEMYVRSLKKAGYEVDWIVY